MNQPNHHHAPKSAELLPDGISLSDLKVVRNYFGEHDKHLVEHKCYFVMDKMIQHIKNYNQPRYVTDEEIDAMYSYDDTELNRVVLLQRRAAKAMRDKIFSHRSA